jgi:glycosyltransferase involved in cell wall biosynthesis
MTVPKVTVVMSVYNDESYIREAVESILNQTFKDFEFIIINDGSTDRTREILLSYKDQRMHLFDQGNMGLTRSLNKGLFLAKGRYIARMDSDDISCPQRLEKEFNFLENNGRVALVGVFVNRIDNNGRFISSYIYPTDSNDLRQRLWMDCPFCHSSVMFRRNCIEKVGNYREKIGPAEDYDLWFRIAEQFEVVNIPEILHQVRINPSGVSLERRFDQVRSTLLVRAMAAERKKYGNDSLDRLAVTELNELLDRLLPHTKKNEQKVLNASYFFLAEIFYVSGNYKQAVKWLSKCIIYNPFSLKGWLLACKLLLRSISST